mgnify:CR=1 FL=1
MGNYVPLACPACHMKASYFIRRVGWTKGLCPKCVDEGKTPSSVLGEGTNKSLGGDDQQFSFLSEQYPPWDHTDRDLSQEPNEEEDDNGWIDHIFTRPYKFISARCEHHQEVVPGIWAGSYPIELPVDIHIVLDSIWIRGGDIYANFVDAPYHSTEQKRLYVSWPDQGVISIARVHQVVTYIVKTVESGSAVGVSCHGGHGRTGTLLACLLVYKGHTANQAINFLRTRYCKKSVESVAQEHLIAGYGRSLLGKDQNIPIQEGESE